VSDLFLERLKRRFIQATDPQATPDAAATDAVVVTDLAGQIILINEAALNCFGHDLENLSGKTCAALLVEGLDCPHQAVTREQPVAERDVFGRDGDRLLHLRVNRFTDADGRAGGFEHLIRDVTSERAIERFLAEVERMSLAGLMVSAVAHEVATPLSVIANLAEMLLMDCERETAMAANLKKIVTQAHRVSELTRHMLDFFRHRPAQFAEVELSELARETLDLVKPELRKARIHASVESHPGTPPVWGDRAQLQQVLLNLITNAIQAMKNGGRLRVIIDEPADPPDGRRAVILAVEDSGCGIAPEVLARVFDFFFTTKVGEGGTGLGLAISKQIVEVHGGTIRAENIDGGGARFAIQMHTAIAKAGAATPEHA
jgi:PAS domain S-box-containing protein